MIFPELVTEVRRRTELLPVDAWVTPTRVGRLIGISAQRIRRAAFRGELSARLMPRGGIVVLVGEVLAWATAARDA